MNHNNLHTDPRHPGMSSAIYFPNFPSDALILGKASDGLICVLHNALCWLPGALIQGRESSEEVDAIPKVRMA